MKTLVSYIKENCQSLTDYLAESLQQSKLFEMAYDRQKYMNYLEGQIDNLVENWCLCKYCSLYDTVNLNHEHWRDELAAIFKKSTRMKCTVSKQRAVHEQLIKKAELNDVSVVNDILISKLKHEHIDTKYAYELVQLFINEIPTLIQLLSTTNKRQLVIDYCYSI